MKPDLPSFDKLLHMARQNPHQLEELRIQLAQHTIAQAPERLRPRLRGLQFQIDSKRRLAKTPLAACIALSDMMHHSLEELRKSVRDLSDTDLVTEEHDDPSPADVLVFPAQ